MKLIERHSTILAQNNAHVLFLEKYLTSVGFKTKLISDVSPSSLAPASMRMDMVFADSDLICAQKSKILFDLKSIYPTAPIVVTLGNYTANHTQIELLKLADAVVDWSLKNPEAIKKVLDRLLSPVTGEMFRIYPRVHRKVKINWREEQSEAYSQGEVINICRGGIFIKQPLVTAKRRNLVHFQFGEKSVPSSVVKGVGVVRWISTPGMKIQDVGFGVEFLAVEGDLGRYIQT